MLSEPEGMRVMVLRPSGSTPEFRALIDKHRAEVMEEDADSLTRILNEPHSGDALRCVLAGHALSRSDPGLAASRLLEYIKNVREIDAASKVIALDGLRHLVNLEVWLGAFVEVGAQLIDDQQAFRALSKVWMRVTSVGNRVVWECELEPWFDSRLMSSMHEFMYQAAALASTNRLYSAIDAAKAAAWRYPRDPAAFSMLASLEIRAERYDNAVEAASAALAIEPTHSKALNFRSFARVKKGEFELALGDLDRAVALEPDDAAARGNRVYCYEALGRYKEAAADKYVLRQQSSRPQNSNSRGGFEAVPLKDGGEKDRGESASASSPAELKLTLSALASANMIDNVGGTLSEYIFDPKTPARGAELAVRALPEFGLLDQIDRVVDDDRVRPELQAIAAGAILRHERKACAEPPPARHDTAVAYLEHLVVDPRGPPAARQIAARELSAHLVATNISDLLQKIPDGGFSGSPVSADAGLPVGILLAKTLGEWRRFDLLRRLGTDTRLNPALREVCCEVFGMYNRDGAVRMLKQLRDEPETPAPVVEVIEMYL
jgi:tetratricopeptide (TPR) repeat protein